MTIRTVDSENVRVPRVAPGEVVLVTRYQEPRAVVVHPEDFGNMKRAYDLVLSLGKLSPRELTAVEAAVVRSAQDEDFDLSLIRDEDLIR